MAEPPEQTEPKPSALDTIRYTPKLRPVDIPPYVPPKDPEPIEGFGAGEVADHRDMLDALTVGDEIRLLAQNNIYLSTQVEVDTSGLGTMAAFVVGDSLHPAKYRALRFREVELQTTDTARIDNVSYSYKAFESNLQRQAVGEASAGFGIPGVFRVDSSYSDTSAISTSERKVAIYLQASQLIPKAKVVFNEDHISLAPVFVSKVEIACNTGTDDQKADKLLALLRDYGHFVPLSMMLGGRISLYTSTELSDKSEFETVRREFKAAVDAKFAVEGVPVQAGGGGGAGTGSTSTATMTEQAKSLLMELKGGDENLAESKARELGTKWIASLGRYREWRVVGFYEDSLAPIIDFLPGLLRETCKNLLKQYFLKQLDCKQSLSLGHKHGEPFEPDISNLKRTTDINVNHGSNFDGLEISYEVYGDRGSTSTTKTKTFGRWRGEYTDHIKLKPGETITAIEACI